MIFLALILMWLGGLKFFVVSFIFFIIGGAFELIITFRFYGSNKKDTKSSSTKSEILNGILWVHEGINFIKINNTTIYEFKKFGLTTLFVSYLTMNFYVGVSLLMYNFFGNYAFILYLLPVITNLKSFFENDYVVKK